MNESMTIRQRHINQDAYDQCLAQGRSEVMARVIAGRPQPEMGIEGITDPRLGHLDSPFSLKDIDQAVKRIITAIQQDEIIALETDHDCDGQTSHAILYVVLTEILGLPPTRLQSYIGHRMQEGYGLSEALAQRILAADPRPHLVITADNGSADEPRIAQLKAAGIDVIVTDHHAIPAEGVPKSAYAVLNPTRPDCPYADPYIAGCMVAWLLMAAVRRCMIELGLLHDQAAPMTEVLDYVAVGTVADCVSLSRSVNNRAVVRYGLHKINQSQRPCWQAIKPLLRRPQMVAEDLGFTVGPLLNSDGRLADAFGSVNFLLSNSLTEAGPWAQQLWEQNQSRKAIQKTLVQQAAQQAQQQVAAGQWSIVAWLPEGHAGVHGIAASRIKDQFGRPTILFSPKLNHDDIITGSARSIDALHMREALQAVADQHPELLVSFGGHHGAAGVSIRLTDLALFKTAFEAAVRQKLQADDIGPVLWTDGVLPADSLSLTLVDELQTLGPYGREFEAPLFEGQFTVAEVRMVGADQVHAQLVLTTGSQSLRAIWFNACEPGQGVTVVPGNQVNVVYQLTDNYFRNQRSLQLQLTYCECCDAKL